MLNKLKIPKVRVDAQAKHAPFLSDVLTNQRMGINPRRKRGAQGEPRPSSLMHLRRTHHEDHEEQQRHETIPGGVLVGDDEELTASQLKTLRNVHGLIPLKDDLV